MVRRTLFYWFFLCSILFSTSAGCSFLESYPDYTEIVEDDETLRILMRDKMEISFLKDHDGIVRIQDLVVGQREVLSTPLEEGLPAISLTLSDNQGDNTNDVTLNLKDMPIVNVEIDGDLVIVEMEIIDGDDIGQLEWIFSPVHLELGQNEYRGLGWKIRLTGIERAVSVNVTEPAMIETGEWTFQNIQGFFMGGPSRSIVSFFDRPNVVQVKLEKYDQYVLNHIALSFGEGDLRETATKIWLMSETTLDSQRAAMDEWTVVSNELETLYDGNLEGITL